MKKKKKEARAVIKECARGVSFINY